MTTATTVEASVRARLVLAFAITVAALALLPMPALAQSPCGASYTFDTGDSFVEIARQCGVTVPALLAANPGIVDESDVEVGNRLRVPTPGAAEPSPVTACGSYYTVRPGDTVAEIAAKCGLTIPLLVAANPPFPQPLGVHAGMKVLIPNVSRAAVMDRATIAVPTWSVVAAAAPGGAQGGDRAAAGAGADSAAIPAVDLIRVEGVLERGPRCMAVRSQAGELHAIAGELRPSFQPGDRVVLMGVPAEEHDCGTSPALELRILYRAGG